MTLIRLILLPMVPEFAKAYLEIVDWISDNLEKLINYIL